jgi:pimeloyl-ACP methyl ester carboxylesterase
VKRLEVHGEAGRLAVWTYRPGPGGEPRTPVLFVHPINLQGACWAGVAPQLAGRLSLLPDLRGHGDSAADGPFGVEEWATDCLSAMDAAGVERAHVVGASLGGPIAVHLAVHVPDRVASIVAIGSALAIRGAEVEEVLAVLREKGVAGMFREVIPQISVAPGTSTEVIERILSLANPNDVETVAAIWGATISDDVTDIAPRVGCPVTVATGEHDLTCPVEQGAAMADRLSTRLVVMPSLGHLPMLEDPAATAALITEHLSRVEREGVPAERGA